MRSWMWLMIAAFIAIDTLFVLFVISKVRSRSTIQVAGQPIHLLSILALLRDSAQELDRSITEFMRGNFSGQKEQLPAALGAALDRARTFVQSRQIGVDEDTLRTYVAHIVTAHKFASRADVTAAMKSVPRPDSPANIAAIS